MDFDLRQWLLILGPVFVIGVLLHGYLRMRAGQNEIRMKLDKSFLSDPGDESSVDDLSLLKAELPNGGARVIFANGQDEDVPVLMESVDLPSIRATDPIDGIDTGTPGEPEMSIEAKEPSAKEPSAREPSAKEPSAREPSAKEPSAKEPSAREPSAKEPSAKVKEPSAREPSAKEGSAEQPAARTPSAKAPPARKKPEEEVDIRNSGMSHKPEKFVVIYVLALDEPFPGQRLLELMMEADMTFGEMDIFHRLQDDGLSEFSLASAVEPGTFNMKELDTFSTPGVTLFMRVHELPEPLRVLDAMLAVAASIANELNGEVRDETRSVMTPQTIEHCRQSVREFQYKHSA